MKSVGDGYSCWDILITSHFRGFRSFTPSDLNNLWPPPKTIGFFLSTWQFYLPNMKSVGHGYLEISWLQAIFGIFAVLPLMTSNDLWPPPKTIGFFLSTWKIHIPNMESVGQGYLEMSRLQAISGIFAVLPLVTSNDLWPPPKIIGFISWL